MSADPKPGIRREIVDPRVGRLHAAAHPECVACGAPGANAHHVLARGDGGDDVAANFVTLCGSGTMRCHGAYHGNPYVVSRGWAPGPVAEPERRDREWVARRIGRHLVDARLDAILYLVDKMGELLAIEYLRSHYELGRADSARVVFAPSSIVEDTIPS